jgi:hypothetical protein
VSSDTAAILASLTMCSTKILNNLVYLTSIRLEYALNLLNRTALSNQTLSLLLCDAENRAYATEWLAYSYLQTGDWLGSLALLRDLLIAHNHSSSQTKHYASVAYSTRARVIIEFFYWFPYKSQFIDRTQQVLALNGTELFNPVSVNETHWYPIWNEAGLRFSK